MKQQRPKILFISHEGTRTGAPIVLLNFLRWLKKEDIYNFEVFFKTGGPLQTDFKEISFTYKPIIKGLVKRFIKDIKNKFYPVKDKFRLPSKLKRQKFDLIVINTVDCLELAPLLKKTFNCNIICHVHENSFTINYYYPQAMELENLQCVDHFIAVSKSTRDNLIEKFGIDAERVSLIYETIPIADIQKVSIPANEIKKELGITNEFIVGGSGLTTWRKGVDLFVRLAVELNKIKPDNNIKLIWIGSISNEFIKQFEYDSERIDIKKQIIFTGVKKQAYNYFQIFDVFALTSREDPFPLVALESASQKKPIICFDNSGGIPELIKKDGGGMVVPYADVTAMAQQILLLNENPKTLLSMGDKAEDIVQQFDVNIVGKQMVAIIERFL